MNKIGNYDTYVNGYHSGYDTYVQSKTGQKSSSLDKTDGTSSKTAELSDDAKKLLKEMQQKYGNMDFIVADYDSEEEAAGYLARGTKEYSVLIGADELEAMAKDKSVKNEYLNKIEGARNELAYVKSQLKESGENVTKLGVSFNDDGTTSLFASLEKMGERQKERLEEAKDAKQAEKAAERNKAYEKVKRTTVKADTADELLDKIWNVNWDSVEEETVPVAGGKFDYFG